MTTLTPEQQLLLEQRLRKERKSLLVVYLLWFFLGPLGLHRFYLGRLASGAALALLAVTGLFLMYYGYGVIVLTIVGLWLLLDAFRIPKMVEEDVQQRRMIISREIAEQIAREDR